LVLEDDPGSTTAVGLAKSVFPPEPVFVRTSYKGRYAILCDRLVKERLYDAAWFLTATQDGKIVEPDPGLSFAGFSAAIAGRAAYIQALT
jgi:Restriction endonuclease XhoI